MRCTEVCIESHAAHFEHNYKCTLSAINHKLIFIFIFARNGAEVDGVPENTAGERAMLRANLNTYFFPLNIMSKKIHV
jgi:hypothetical protein